MTEACLHVSWEQESAATDGMCPICLAARVTYYRDMWKAQKAESDALEREVTWLRAALPWYVGQPDPSVFRDEI
jgi:hypothetical protein